MIREKDIKAALIDWLYDRGQLDDAVIVNEMAVANWSRRADIAVANGRLYAYEIKSSADTLKRLPGQVDLFACYFDKVTVVAATKFVSKILESYPSEVGVLEVIDDAGVARIRQVRSGRLSETRDAAILSGFLTKVDLLQLLKSEGVEIAADLSRRALVKEVSNLPIRPVKRYVLSRIKEKYRDTFEAFSLARSTSGTLESISMLSRRGAAVRAAFEQTKRYSQTSFSPNPNAKPLKLTGFEFLNEDLSGLPSTVISRRKKV